MSRKGSTDTADTVNLLRKTVAWQDHLNQIPYIQIGCGTWPGSMEENGRPLHLGISF